MMHGRAIRIATRSATRIGARTQKTPATLAEILTRVPTPTGSQTGIATVPETRIGIALPIETLVQITAPAGTRSAAQLNAPDGITKELI
jgi:hypothetical protein